MSHTPTPWFYDDKQRDGRKRGYIRTSVKDAAGNNRAVCRVLNTVSFAEVEENAAFIVRAVNCHDDLVNALQMALPELKRARHTSRNGVDILNPIISLVEQVIAKAEGK